MEPEGEEPTEKVWKVWKRWPRQIGNSSLLPYPLCPPVHRRCEVAVVAMMMMVCSSVVGEETLIPHWEMVKGDLASGA